MIISWDLGATNCSVGVIDYQPKTEQLTCVKKHNLKLTTVNSLNELIDEFEHLLGIKMSDADAICIGGAGQYDGEVLRLEKGYPYPMTFADIAIQRHWPLFAVIHDYAPIVCATFSSYMASPDNIKRLNQCDISPLGRRVAFGIGTGLGLKDGMLLNDGNFWLGHNEIGHIGLATPPHVDKSFIDRHVQLIQYLANTNQHITFETILSGKGLVNLYQFLYGERADITPEIVGDQMQSGNAEELLDLFAWYCGLFVGSLELIFMPQGGIWIAGGVALTHRNTFDRPAFHHGVEASPAYKHLREHYPLGMMQNPDHALIGGGYFAVKRLLAR